MVLAALGLVPYIYHTGCFYWTASLRIIGAWIAWIAWIVIRIVIRKAKGGMTRVINYNI